MSAATRKVLLLDASYCPLGIIEMWRAVLLTIKGSAELVQADVQRPLRTSRGSYTAPSIVRLTVYRDIRRRRRESGKQRFRIFVRDKFRCQYCAKKFGPQDLTLDHILPQSRGGQDEQENLATSCKPCNQRKGARSPDEARMPLLATPSALRYGLDRAMMDYYAEKRPEWAVYLYKEEVKAAVA